MGILLFNSLEGVMKMIPSNEKTGGQAKGVFEKVKWQVSVFINGRLAVLPVGEPFALEGLKGSVDPIPAGEETMAHVLSLKSELSRTVPFKIFVSHRFQGTASNLVFVSPVKDVLFHANEHALFISSGMMKGKSICQSGALPCGWTGMDEFRRGILPFSPIRAGQIEGVFSLESSIAPDETVIARFWLIASKNHDEKELLEMDERMKNGGKSMAGKKG